MNSITSDIIPQDWSQWSETKPQLIKPLAGGLTNQNYLISVDKVLCVLRINSPISAALDLNRAVEKQALQHADKAGLCAALVYCDPDYHYLLTRYIPNQAWTIDNGLPQLAQLLRNIHQLDAVDGKLDITEKIKQYWQGINSQSDFMPKLASLKNVVKPYIETAAHLSEGLCLCHNDLILNNVVFADDGTLYAIDWEYAAMADPFHDLAVIAEEYELNAEQQAYLLNTYLQREVAGKDRQRLYCWRVLYRYLTLLWYAVQLSNNAMPDVITAQSVLTQFDKITALIAKNEILKP